MQENKVPVEVREYSEHVASLRTLGDTIGLARQIDACTKIKVRSGSTVSTWPASVHSGIL